MKHLLLPAVHDVAELLCEVKKLTNIYSSLVPRPKWTGPVKKATLASG